MQTLTTNVRHSPFIGINCSLLWTYDRPHTANFRIMHFTHRSTAPFRSFHSAFHLPHSTFRILSTASVDWTLSTTRTHYHRHLLKTKTYKGGGYREGFAPMQINAYQEGTKINTKVNEQPLKNIGTHWNIRHCWFQRVPISFNLARKTCNLSFSCDSDTQWLHSTNKSS